MAYKGDPEKDLMVQYLDHKTISLQTVINAIDNMKITCDKNHIDPKDVPFIIKTNNLKYAIPWYGIGYGVGRNGMVASIDYYSSDKIMPIVHDERPVEGEYWQTRGVSDGLDVSGFVKSKAAGERLRRMVRLVLEKDEIESWLDWREYEPEWIQFKFMATEFDVQKLHDLSKEHDGVITLRTLEECKLKK